VAGGEVHHVGRTQADVDHVESLGGDSIGESGHHFWAQGRMSRPTMTVVVAGLFDVLNAPMRRRWLGPVGHQIARVLNRGRRRP